MNKYVPYAGLIISIALAMAVVFTLEPLFAAIIVGVPLMFLERKYSTLSGFVIGLAVPFLILLTYPIASIEKLAGIVSQLTGMPPDLLLVVYPLMFGVITAVSALMFTGIREILVQEAPAKQE